MILWLKVKCALLESASEVDRNACLPRHASPRLIANGFSLGRQDGGPGNLPPRPRRGKRRAPARWPTKPLSDRPRNSPGYGATEPRQGPRAGSRWVASCFARRERPTRRFSFSRRREKPAPAGRRAGTPTGYEPSPGVAERQRGRKRAGPRRRRIGKGSGSATETTHRERASKPLQGPASALAVLMGATHSTPTSLSPSPARTNATTSRPPSGLSTSSCSPAQRHSGASSSASVGQTTVTSSVRLAGRVVA